MVVYGWIVVTVLEPTTKYIEPCKQAIKLENYLLPQSTNALL